MNYQLGRKPRIFNPRVPHYSAIAGAKKDIAPPPATVDWRKGVSQWGMMLNDTWGDCTCAAVYHLKQVQTLNTSQEITEPDSNVLALYEQACGFDPNNPTSTDNGGVEQDVLTYLLNIGAPAGNGGRDKILAFVEVDPRNINDVKHTINDCGAAYIGFNVPNSLMANGNPAPLWDVDPNNSGIDGGHAIVLPGYDDVGPYVISWGSNYQMTWSFFSTYVDEAYAICSPDWIASTGKTPLDMSVQDLEQLMSAIKE